MTADRHRADWSGQCLEVVPWEFGLQGRELLGRIGVGSLVRRYEIHTQAGLGDVTRREPETWGMWDFPKSLVYFP